MAELPDIYEKRGPTLQQARQRLHSILAEVVAAIEDKTLVRAEVRSIRVTGLASIQRKASAKGWTAEEALTACSDIIGGRVVCNNVEDVYRFAELLKERLPGFQNKFAIQDHIKAPNPGGYRALHVNFHIDASEHPGSARVPCEVQIRSRLQDAWAELSHDDIYKQPNLPEDLRARAKDLAEVLAAADKIASDIRSRVMKETTPPEHRPNLTHVSPEGLAFLFQETFGRSPPAYIIRRALNVCDEYAIKSLEGLPGVLGRESFRQRVAEAYESIMPAPIGAENLFLVALHALARGDSWALAKVRRDARREWREIDQFARREMLASLPATIDELMEEIESPGGGGVESWAEALDATNKCGICGETIVRPFAFAEAVLRHYDVSDDEADDIHERIEIAVRNSSTETGGWGDGSLCAYHNEQMAKDD
jgi:ppGpp synthetase/RelA/SpoT-type nucleotidyltranferase